MPTFTAIALDRLLEPDAPKSMIATNTVPHSELEKLESVSTRVGRGVQSTSTRLNRGVSVPPKLENGTSLPSSKTDSKNSTSSATVERNSHWTRISPALYATPKSTPIPDSPISPSSFPPSPYVINHKRRGPRLLKSYSEDDVGTNQRGPESHNNVDRHENNSEHLRSASDDSSILKRVLGSASDDFSTSAVSTPGQEKEENDSLESVREVHVEGSVTSDNQVDGTFNLENQKNVNGHCDTDSHARKTIPNLADQINAENTESFISQGEDDEFLNPRDSVSSKRSTDIEAVGGIEQSTNSAIALSEFYDAWEELSSENGPQQQPLPDVEAELREIRLSLLMEIEKRKQAEETFNTMCTQWQKFRSRLNSIGLTLPADPLALTENEQLEDSAQELGQQVYLARFVSNSIGRGIAKAEVEMEMEAQLELKNFEITRLSDRLRYYEAVNREMSQRNQEAIDNARRLRQTRKRRQKWVWGSVAAAITVGSAVLAWSYTSSSKGTPSSRQSNASEGDHASRS